MNLSKFQVPRTSSLLERDHLVAKLAAWSDRKLVIIHAQAGQGKSTLAAAYAASLPTPPVWYTMDAQDEDPAVFLAGLGEALQAALREQAPKVPPVPRSRYGFSGVEQTAIIGWIDRLFGAVARPCLVVFDDCHIPASSPALRPVLKALIESSPSSVRFLLISRTRPELDIAKLRARRGVAELRGSDLMFSDREAQELFGTAFGMPLAPREAALINRAAEGWAAGLVLMHEYLASAPAEGRLETLRGRPHSECRAPIFDYLAQEVFLHLPEGLQDFLLRTSVAEELTAPLLSLLSGLPESAPGSRPSVAARVAELGNRNLFVTSVGGEAASIRYHALFREFLVRQLRSRRPPAEIRKYYAIAANHFAGAGDPARAVNLWLESGQTARAVRGIESCGLRLVGRGQTRMLIRWIDSLPKPAADRPWFRFYRAISLRYADPRAALTLYERAERGFRRDRDVVGQMLSLSGIIEACFHSGGDFRRMERAAARAQALLDQRRREAPEARARLHLAIGMAWFFIGRLRQGTEALTRALDLFRQQGDHFYQITSAVYLAPCALYQGDFPLAREAVRRGIDAHASIPDEAGGRAALFLMQAMTALFEGNFAEARECIDQCGSLADSNALESIGFLSLDIGGWLKIAEGDYRGAELQLAECRRRGEASRNAFISASAAHLLAIACLFQGKLKRAKVQSDYALAVQAGSGSRLFHAIYLIASGAIHLRLGTLPRAERDLMTALKMLRQAQAVQQEANAHLLLAALSLRRGQEAAARRHLAAGFGIGEERGFTYYALLDREERSALAAAAIERGIEPAYCRGLIANGLPQRTSWSLEIFCLGEFRVLRNGVPLQEREWKSRLAKTLVKLLAKGGYQKLSRDDAAEILWPDADPARLPLMLNSLLHRTRKALEPAVPVAMSESCIVQDGSMLSLNRMKARTDIGDFLAANEAVARNRSKAPDDPERTLVLHDAAIKLYRGDFLPGDLYDDWTQPIREELRKLYLQLLSDAAEVAESGGDEGRAWLYYDKMFAHDQCNEKACRWLMSRHAAAGQRGEAVRIYERCQLSLRQELDIEPDAQTRKMYRSIIGG